MSQLYPRLGWGLQVTSALSETYNLTTKNDQWNAIKETQPHIQAIN